MDRFITRANAIYYKVENENDLANFQSESYIKEEIILPDLTECFVHEAPNTANHELRADQISFERLIKDNNKLIKDDNKLAHKICNQADTDSDEEIDVVNVDTRNEKLFAEPYNFDNNRNRIDECSIKMEVDVSLNEESLLHDVSDYPDKMCTLNSTSETRNLLVDDNDNDKENMNPAKKECQKSQKQTTMFNYLKRSSPESNTLSSVPNNTKTADANETHKIVDNGASKATPKGFKNKGDKLNTAILVCPICAKKEKILSTRPKTICKDCKEPMTYECLTCGDRISTISAIYSHIEKKCGRQQMTYQCKQCSYIGKSEYLLRVHMTSRHDAEMECPKCSKKFKLRGDLVRHKEECGLKVRYLRCKFCPFDTKHKNNITKHIKKAHKNIKPQQLASIMKDIIEEGEKIKANVMNSADCTEVNMMPRTIEYRKYIQLYCTKCDEIYQLEKYLKERDCRKCGAVTLLQCVKCAKRYPKTTTMYSHLAHKCAARNSFQCAHCEYSAPYKKRLEIHIGRRHTIVAPEDYQKCSKCDRRYKYHLDRIHHERHCGREQVLQCQYCPFKTKVKSYFKIHMQNHILHPSVDDTTTPAPADVTSIKVNAPKPMSRKEELKVEKLAKPYCPKCKKNVKYTNRGRRPCDKCGTSLTYPCHKCGKIYIILYHLRTHVINKHLSSELKKRQQCSACGLRFTLHLNLRRHQKYCVKQPDLQCAHCPFKTKYRKSLIEHLQKKHGKENKPVVRPTVIHEPTQFVCAQCGKGYSTNRGLKVHIQFYCGKQPSFACDHCSFKAYRKNPLIIHLKGMHNHLFTNQTLRCKHCGKESTNIYTHNSHVTNCSFK